MPTSPESRSSEFAGQTHGPLPKEVRHDFDVPPTEGVKLPFAHTGAITRNPNFYGQTDALDEINCAFGLKDRPRRNEPRTSSLQNLNLSQDDDPYLPKTYILCGMAGISKDRDRLQVSLPCQISFDAVILIYANTTRKLGAQFVALAKELMKGEISDSIDEVSAYEAIKAWLAAPVGYRKDNGRSVKVEATWLMVFDNADDPDIRYDWLPSQGPGCILVTGKYSYVREATYCLDRGLDLETFLPKKGRDMLRKLSRREKETDAMEASSRISRALRGLPLAIFR